MLLICSRGLIISVPYGLKHAHFFLHMFTNVTYCVSDTLVALYIIFYSYDFVTFHVLFITFTTSINYFLLFITVPCCLLPYLYRVLLWLFSHKSEVTFQYCMRARWAHFSSYFFTASLINTHNNGNQATIRNTMQYTVHRCCVQCINNWIIVLELTH